MGLLVWLKEAAEIVSMGVEYTSSRTHLLRQQQRSLKHRMSSQHDFLPRSAHS